MCGGRLSGVHGAGSRGLSGRQLPDVRLQGERHTRIQAGADAVRLVTSRASSVLSACGGRREGRTQLLAVQDLLVSVRGFSLLPKLDGVPRSNFYSVLRKFSDCLIGSPDTSLIATPGTVVARRRAGLFLAPAGAMLGTVPYFLNIEAALSLKSAF